MNDTIFALATAQGKAGVAMVRISGPASKAVLERLGGKIPEPRSTRVCKLIGEDGAVLDQALVLYFAAGHSFTGEDVVELHLHGSVAIVRAILSTIERSRMARLAEAGEFTKRALMNGRMDLSQVRGLGDLIDAETAAQRDHAMRVFGGEMTVLIEEWRFSLIRAIALLEAVIDFSEEDIPEDLLTDVHDVILQIRSSIQRQVVGAASARRLREGYEVAIIGAPNVGKSTLLNRLANSDAAIVTEYAGTTRDVIEARLDLNGIPVVLLDTAGLRDSSDPVEKIGIERAVQRATRADLRIFLYTGTAAPEWPIERMEGDLVVRTKVDLDGLDGISSHSGAGINTLTSDIVLTLEPRVRRAGLVSHERELMIAETAMEQLDEILKDVMDQPVEIVAMRLREVLQSMERFLGVVNIEDVLGEIFGSFCIGK